MTQVKIVSDPYRRETSFACRGDSDREWAGLNPRSRLLSDEAMHGFFPFKVKGIVDAVIEEFWDSREPVGIVFEGAGDEYRELEAICVEDDVSGRVRLERSPRRLLNARDILPEIVGIFNELRPFFEENVRDRSKIESDLDKFADASSDAIPLCVMGNYSAGKSTFINALIGMELLPSGDMPVTARVYQIRRSGLPGVGRISFSCDDNDVTLEFDDGGFAGATGAPVPAVLSAVTRALTGSGATGLGASMNVVLRVVNDLDASQAGGDISDLVRIDVPFSTSDTWGLEHEFVIFDTPGSNSATRADHLRILRDAMEGMSNGLLVYVSEFDSLDSVDNLALYDDIRRIDALDDRFAIVVVNKADAAQLPRSGMTDADRLSILRQAIPARMYSQGIFFVSSIIALGSKTDGDFVSDYYAEKFEDQQRKYSDPTARFYKTLYRYDIMPEQILARFVRESEACPDLMLANSGMLAVEQAMEEFAGKYASYNKCLQSEQFLGRLIEVTREELAAAKANREESRRRRNEALDEDKRRLTLRLEGMASEVQSRYVGLYRGSMASVVEASCDSILPEALQKEEAARIEDELASRGYDDTDERAHEATHAIGDNLGTRFNDVLSRKSGESVTRMVQGVLDDAKEALDAHKSVRSMRSESEKGAADKLLEDVRDRFDHMLASGNEAIVSASRSYWADASEASRRALYDVVTGSTELEQEKRDELAGIIADYHSLELVRLPQLLPDKERMHGLWLGNFQLISSDRLNVRKVAATYNDAMREAVEERLYPRAEESHRRSYVAWLQELLGLLVENVVDYNPSLRGQAEIIREDSERIAELERGMEMLDRHRAHIARMMSWEERVTDDGDR